jgi:hypothetical protein
MNKEFENQGYLYLKNFINSDSAKQLATSLKEAVSQNPQRDTQCPKSLAVYAHPVFDCLLEELQPHLEKILGKRLYPTYSYARLYQPGETLLAHQDRPACEISVTLALDAQGTPWPIYFADESQNIDDLYIKGERDYHVKNKAEITMNPGDAALYKGCEKVHWREEFFGDWAAQVFLHYVDANGPYATERFDKRSKLAHHTDRTYSFNQHFASTDFYRVYPNMFDKEFCDNLIMRLSEQQITQAAVGEENTINKTIRDVNLVNLPSDRGIGAALTGIAIATNHESYKFSVTHSNQTDFLRYDVNGHYHTHLDTMLNPSMENCRKLTTLLFLNDDFEGGQLFLQVSAKKHYPFQKTGTVLVFPSFLLHGVEPVTNGTRYSIVNWLVGPWFK